MSIRLAPGMCRLTVLGNGWYDTAIDSGEGLTDGGDILEEIADLLDYDPGDDTDWDAIADDDWPDYDPTRNIYTDDDGNIYTDDDGDDIWTNPDTGEEYPGGGDKWIPEDDLVKGSNTLSDTADKDSDKAQYNIPEDDLSNYKRRKVSGEEHVTQTSDPDRPHRYSPPVYYHQNGGTASLFLGEPFVHTTKSGGNIEVYEEAVTLRDGSKRAIYRSTCTTQFSDNDISGKYPNVPDEYICWQELYGPIKQSLIAKKETTIITDQIIDGTSGLESMVYNGKTYYKLKPKQGSSEGGEA